MKANEFVKKFGLDEARKQIKKTTGIYGAAFDYQFMDDLKRLVESHDLIDLCGGLDVAKNLDPRFLPNWVESVNQAIADVESCQ